MKQTSLFNRILSGILAVVLLLSMVPVEALGTELITEELVPETVTVQTRITRMDEAVEMISLYAHDRIEINAEGGDSATAYQWQILYPGKQDVWVNIYDATYSYLYVTLALIRNMMTEELTACIRCRLTMEETVAYTNPVTVQFCPEQDDLERIEIPALQTEPTEPAELVEEPASGEFFEEIIVEELVEEPGSGESSEEIIVEELVEELVEEIIPEETFEVTEEEEIPGMDETEGVSETAAAEDVPETAEFEAVQEAVMATTVSEMMASDEICAQALPEETEPVEQDIEAEETVPAETAEVVLFAAGEPEETDPETAAEETVFEDEAISGEEPVTATEPEPVITSPAKNAADLVKGASDVPEFVTVTIRYRRYDYVLDENGQICYEYDYDEDGNPIASTMRPVWKKDDDGNDGHQAFSDYVATVKSGSASDQSSRIVPNPTLVGYDAYWVHDGQEIKCTEVTIELDNLLENKEYLIIYKPAEVSYTVRYYFQNIYDDLYVENQQLAPALTEEGYTGTAPSVDLMTKPIDGFLPLYYQPDTIAADGSTVFEVYYERNYYLMEFQCNGGYGTETLYIRYGTYISVPDPVRPGWIFGGWDLISTDNKNNTEDLNDGSANNLLDKMPAYNSGYIALWTTGNTTYTIAYWLKEAGKDDRFLGSYQVMGTSNDPVQYGDNLGHDKDGAVCGKYGHTHTAACFKCGNPNHDHSESCYSCGMVDHDHSRGCYAGSPVGHSSPVTDATDAIGWNAILAANGGYMDISEDYIYIAGEMNATSFWPKMFINGTLYNVTINGQQSINMATLESIVDGERQGYGEYVHSNGVTYFGAKYKINMTCGKEEHTHTETCSECGLHEHTAQCRQDSHYLTYRESDTVAANQGKIIKGDGSTVVNVYYEYKTYTLRFYYAKSQTENGSIKYYVVGGTTWPFGGYNHGNEVNENTTVEKLLSWVGDWGQVQDVPTIQSKYLSGETKRYDTGSISSGTTTYYYLEFNAKYGDNLENLWPVDIFEPALIQGTHSNRPGLKYAYFSAWNGEYCVKYTQDRLKFRPNYIDNENQTIKGKYMELDSEIIYDRVFQDKILEKDGKQTVLVNYLGFWENGDNTGWSNPKEFRYHIMKKTEDTTEEKDKIYRTYNGVKYKQYDEFIVYDNNVLTEKIHQTAVGLTGYTHVGTETANANDRTDYSQEVPVLPSVDYYFYYDPTIHTITFWNHSEYLTSGVGSKIAYDTPLKQYGVYATNMVYDSEKNPTGRYPSKLEAGAYEFDAWYTTEGCIPGTEMNWDQNMPDSDFIVYAHWQPVVHRVRFYNDYKDVPETKDLQGTPLTYVDNDGNAQNAVFTDIQHGTKLNSDLFGKVKADKGSEYRFVGWFYFDRDGKKRFAPDTMEINQDLDLFAEWTSRMDTTYRVRYVLDDDVEAKDTVSGANSYKKGDEVASEIFAHASVGKTKTFNAKTLGELYPDFRKKFFPTVNSHSILMEVQPEATEENPNPNEANVYTFYYVYDPSVKYKIRYVDALTGADLLPPDLGDTEEAIITVKFKPIQGYLPRNYYIRKVLASDGTATTPIAANEIVFEYVEDKQHGLYSIEYYLEDLNGGTFSLYESVVGQAELMTGGNSTVITAERKSYDGYTVDPSKHTVINYEFDEDEGKFVEKPTTGSDKTEDPPSGKLDYAGLTIQLYYTRNSYPYYIEYREHGTENVLKSIHDGTPAKKLGDTFSYSLVDATTDRDDRIIYAKKTINNEEVDVAYEFYLQKPDEEDLTRSKTIRHYTQVTGNAEEDKEANPNKIIFYFVEKKVTIEYVPVCTDPDLVSFCTVSLNQEKGIAGQLLGSMAMEPNGFRFVGWYADAEFTEKITNEESKYQGWLTENGTMLTPQAVFQNESFTNTYYALFEPVVKDLKIKKIVDNPDDEDSFIFHIKSEGEDAIGRTIDLKVVLQANQSVTIPGLYGGSYTVTELTGWSWTYTNTGSAIQTVEITKDQEQEAFELTFTNRPKTVRWLHGENHLDNRFAAVIKSTD